MQGQGLLFVKLWFKFRYMFSSACETALRLLTFTAAQELSVSRLSILDLARATDTPVAYAAKILQVLSRKGLISSAKGPNGGFFLEQRQFDQLTAFDVVEAIDGLALFKTCMLGLRDCSGQRPCPMHQDFVVIRTHLEAALRRTTLQALAARYRTGQNFISLNNLND